MDRYGLVYMGSKEKILHLIRYIFEREYKKENFIDLFCGGFSVSNFALQKTNFNVYSNDLNKYVIALYEEVIFNDSKQFEKIKYKWISREEFNNVRDYPDMYPQYYVGYVLTVWSFGCNQRDYLYAKDLEADKEAIHQAIVFDDWSLIRENPTFKGLYEAVPENIRAIDYTRFKAKRVHFMQYLKEFIKERQLDEQLGRLQQLERVQQIESLSQMEHVDVINKAVKSSNRLKLGNVDYIEFYESIPKEVLEKSFIYCDPPYEDTKKYHAGKDFDYEKFWQWFRDCPYPVYVSSYKAPSDIEPLNFELKQVNLDNGNKNTDRFAPKKKAVENIYWNGKGDAVPMMEDLLFGQLL